MPIREENLRFILGLKLKTLRQEQQLPLRAVAERAGLSISYLSEIEKGKKYPKPDKLITLAEALDVPFDELVSLQVDEALDPLKTAMSSTFVQEFPFELFGVEPQELFGLMSDEPTKAGALFRTFLEIVQTYDVRVEHFLFAALRSYQQLHANYFEELEEAADAFRAAHDWPADAPLREAMLRAVLEDEFGYTIDLDTLPEHPELHRFRSVFADRTPPRLFVNGRLSPTQRAFAYAREIGFRHLELVDRPITSSWIKAESFEQVLNNFKASYFAGALFVERDALREDLEALFGMKTWQPDALLEAIDRHNVTPEMFFYRVGELVPKFFGLREFYFLRFYHTAGTDEFRLTKAINMSSVPIPYGLEPVEDYGDRWPAMALLRRLANRQRNIVEAGPIVSFDRTVFTDEDVEFAVFSVARPRSLTDGVNTGLSLGFVLDDRFKRTVRFWNDPGVPRTETRLAARTDTTERTEQALEAFLHELK